MNISGGNSFEGKKLSSVGPLYESILEHYNQHIIGQEHVKNLMAEVLSEVHQDLNTSTGPLRVLFFKGPTGVGKSEIAKQTANLLFGNPDGIVKINCEQFNQYIDINKLFGVAPGYLGHGQPIIFSPENIAKAREEGFQKNTLHKIAKNKEDMAVIVFDEIEKMHPQIRQGLLTLIDEGKTKLATGQEISIKNSIIIFTSNVGEVSAQETMQSVGFGNTKENHQEKQLQQKEKIFNETFSPEFIGRMNHIVEFDPLKESFVDDSINKYKIKLINEVLILTKGKITIQYDKSVDEYIQKHINISKGNRNIANTRDNHIAAKVGVIIKYNKLTYYKNPQILKLIIEQSSNKLEGILNPDPNPKKIIEINENGKIIPLNRDLIPYTYTINKHINLNMKYTIGNLIKGLQEKEKSTNHQNSKKN